jgi:hypothetical protein
MDKKLSMNAQVQSQLGRAGIGIFILPPALS